jgi:hypothetical protein
MQADVGCRSFFSKTVSLEDSKQVLHKGFLVSTKKELVFQK